MTEKEALKLALEALEAVVIQGDVVFVVTNDGAIHLKPAITAIKEALVQPKQDLEAPLTLNGVALYPQRTWIGLTLDERIELAKDVDWPVGAYCEYAEKIEAKLRSKND